MHETAEAIRRGGPRRGWRNIIRTGQSGEAFSPRTESGTSLTSGAIPPNGNASALALPAGPLRLIHVINPGPQASRNWESQSYPVNKR